MKKVALGSTGLQVSPLCFGTWQLSEVFWGKQSKLLAPNSPWRALVTAQAARMKIIAALRYE